MTAKERLRQRAAGLKINNAPQVIAPQLPQLKRAEDQAQERQEQEVLERAQKVQAQRSGSIDPAQVNRTPAQDRARMTRANSQYQLGDVRSKQGRVGAAVQSIGMNTAGSVQYLGETIQQANQNTRDYLQSQAAEDYAAAVSDFNRIRKMYMEDAPEYIAAYNRMQEARKASEELLSPTVEAESKGSRMMAESRALQEKALEGTTGAGRLLGETAISVASNLSKLPLGAAAPALMGAEAAAGKAYDLQQQGVGAGEALRRGVTSGAIEGVTEKMGLDNLFDLVKTGGKSALKSILKQAGVEGTEEGFSYAFNYLADKMAQDPNAKFSLQELLESIGSGAVSGLAFGAGGTLVNRSGAVPHVIEQTGTAKQAPAGTSLHLADGQVQGLPMVEKPVETVQNLPLKKQESGKIATEPQSLPMAENKNTAGQSQAVKNKSIYTKKDATWEGQDRNNRQNGITEAQEASSKNTVAQAESAVKPNAVEPTGLPMKAETSFITTQSGNKMHAEWEFDGGRVEANEELERLQVFFDGKPSEEVRKEMRANGFLWAPSQKAWQRKLTDNAYAAAGRLSMLQPSSGKSVAELQREALKAYGDRKIQERMAMTQAEQTVTEPNAVEPTGLPMQRREEIQDALTASVNGGRTLGDNERRTGLPLPTKVESQLQALEALTQEQEDASDVANNIRKYVGEDAANYWLEHRNESDEEAEPLNQRPTPEHSGAVTDEAGNVIGTEAMAKLGVRIEGGIADLTKVQRAREAQWGLDVTNRQIAQAEKDLHASGAEKRMAENVAKGVDTLDSYQYGWDGKDNRRRSVVEELSALYRLRDTYDRNAVKALGRKNKDVFINTLNGEILNHLEQATPPGAVSLHTNTWDRNNLRTWGRELGEKVNQMIFDPIKENEASRIRWLNGQVDDMKILGELTDDENQAVFDMLDNGKETATYDGVRNEVVQEAADKLRQKYSDYYDAINDVLVAHGYPEIGFIKNYAPHTNDESVKKAMSIFERLGLADTVTELPTEIAGRTDVFKPGKKWNPHFLHRTGEKTALDAVGGYLSYVNYMSEVLHHVDDIQKVRTFGDQIRYLYGDEGLQADYDAIRADTTMNEQEKEQELEKLRERQTDNSKMGAYVTALDNYANILAGKQTQLDRAVESAIGRRGLNWIQKPIQMLVRSSIPGNLSSAVNQTVQLPWLTAEAGEANVLQAAFDLSRGKLRKENFAAESTFITGKRGAEILNSMKQRTAGEKVVDGASKPFEVVDDAVSQVIVRAFYLKNIKVGMDHKSAMRQADRQAEKLVGSRMKGTKANIFSDKSLKMLTTFQLEVANQWQHLKFDLPQEFRDMEKTKGRSAAVTEASKRILKATIYTFVLNNIIEQITGSKPAGYDIIGAIWDYIQAGQPDEEEEEQKFDPTAGLSDLGKSLADDIPFVGNIGAVLGIGDGRLPLPSIDRETIGAGIKKRINAENDEEKKAGWSQIGAGVLKSAATMLPMGNQIKKTIQGGSDAIRGGRYSADGTQLLYEVESSPANIARGLLFGRNALPETREYWDKGGKAVLSQKQTGLMKQAEDYGVDQSTYVDFVRQAKKLNGDPDAEGDTIKGSLERKKISLLDGMDLSGEQKLQLYLDNVASDSRKEDVDAMAAAGMSWEQMAPAIDTYLSLEAEDLNATQKATQLAAWADQNLDSQQAAVVKERLEYWQMMQAEASTYEKLAASGVSSQVAQKVYNLYQTLEPELGKSQVTENQKKKAVVNSTELTEADKQAVIRSMLSGDAVGAFDRCMEAGVSARIYVDTKDYYSNAKAEEDKNGKSITGNKTGSKKDKVWKYINGLAVSKSQKDALSVLCGYDSDLEEAPWHNGIVGLPMIDVQLTAKPLELPTLPEVQPMFTLPSLP